MITVNKKEKTIKVHCINKDEFVKYLATAEFSDFFNRLPKACKKFRVLMEVK